MTTLSLTRAQRRALTSAGLLLGLTAQLACSSTDTAIALHVTGIPTAATELRVLASVDGQTATSPGSYAPPAAPDSDLRLGIRLVNRSTGQATLEVAACNSACLLAQSRTQIDLSLGNAEPTADLIPQSDTLDLRLCAARAAILCSLQLERNAQTGESLFGLHGTSFATGSELFADGTRLSASTVSSSTRIEFPQFPLFSKDSTLVEVKNPDQSSILRRLSVAGLPLAIVPKTLDASQPTSQIDRIPFVTQVAVADLDGDGNLDIALTGAFFVNAQGAVPNKPGFLALYWGDGKRGFVRGDLVTGLTGIPRAITVGSMKGTGLPQILVSSGDPVMVGSAYYAIDFQVGGSLLVFDPSAPRTYGAPIEVRPTPAFSLRSPHQAVVMDVDGDGQNDLVVALSNYRTLLISDYGAVLWWKGAGASWSLGSLTTDMPKVLLDRTDTFPLALLPWSGPTGTQPGSLAMTVYNRSASRAELRILNNLSAATPTLTSTQPLGGTPLQLLDGDFSGDGQRDLLVTLPLGNDRKTQLRRIELFTRVGTTGNAEALDLPQPFSFAAVLDLFGDRRDDLVLYSSKDGIAQLGVFVSRSITPHIVGPTYGVQLLGAGQALLGSADLDRDGHADVISATTGTLDAVSPFTTQLDVFFGR